MHEFTGVVTIPGAGLRGSTLFVTGERARAALAAGTGTRQRRRHPRQRGIAIAPIPTRPPGPALKRAAVRPTRIRTAMVRSVVKAKRPIPVEMSLDRTVARAIKAGGEFIDAVEDLERRGVF